ncbi:hypothetical protein V6N13_053519 [Hibiscus sabdariffa]|uniref:Uncharacterized protein n=1 Tax=Hibiscus sabdariffa TaxID=183260 RepID=A0ABR2T7B0_9ROSI
MAWPRSMAYPEVVWRALVASLLRVAAGRCGVFSFACFAQGMTALWFWRCPACMAVYVSFTRLLDGPFTSPWSIGLSSLSGVGLPCGFGKTRSLLVLFRCLACLGIVGALFVAAYGARHLPTLEAFLRFVQPLWLRLFASIGAPPLRHVQALPWLVFAPLLPSEGLHWPIVGCCVEFHPHPVNLCSKMPSPQVKGLVPYKPS